MEGDWGSTTQLDPEQAGQILHRAMTHYQGKYQYPGEYRAKIALALWRLAGQSETKFVLDWFYGEQPSRGTTPRDEFLLSAAAIPHGRRLLASLVRDQRFDKLDWGSLEQPAAILDGWTSPPVIGEQRGNAQYPDTPDRFESSREELDTSMRMAWEYLFSLTLIPYFSAAPFRASSHSFCDFARSFEE